MSRRQKRKRSVFVIMPFKNTPLRDKDDLTAFFEVNLKQRVESETSLKYQYVVRRSEDSLDITAQILRDVYEADIVLCDLSGNDANPNVMYELGVRLAISNKPVILFREANPDNNPIFDIAGFYAHEYSPQQYKKLEDFVIAKLRKFESGQETYESPVLKVLKTDPTVINEINRKRVIVLLDSFIHQVVGLQRVVGGAVSDFLDVYNVEHKFRTPDEAIDFIENNRTTLAHLPWENLQILPHAMPAITSFLVELPLSDMIPAELEKQVNTFVAEYYNVFFSSSYAWLPPSFRMVHKFLVESYYLRRVLTGGIILTQQAHNAEAEKIIANMREIMKESDFSVLTGDDEEEDDIARKAVKSVPAANKAKPARRSAGKKKSARTNKDQSTKAPRSKAKSAPSPAGRKKASRAKKK